MIPTYKFALREDLKDKKEFLPTRAEPLATGWDVRCAEPNGVTLVPNRYYKIKLGFRMLPPSGWWADLRPRSSTFGKKHLHCLYGVLDESWEGESMLAVQWCPDDHEYRKLTTIKFGDRIAQIIPVRRQEMLVEEATNIHIDYEYTQRKAVRGAGGFGSTGSK